MLIGLTGRNASGKGEVAKYLQKKSFYYYSLSNVIRDEIRLRGEEPTRDRLIIVGNQLEMFGARTLPLQKGFDRVDDVMLVVFDLRENAFGKNGRALSASKLIADN